MMVDRDSYMEPRQLVFHQPSGRVRSRLWGRKSKYFVVEDGGAYSHEASVCYVGIIATASIFNNCTEGKEACVRALPIVGE